MAEDSQISLSAQKAPSYGTDMACEGTGSLGELEEERCEALLSPPGESENSCGPGSK